MADTKLKRGDLVVLKSGSPKMVISEIKTEIKQSVSNPIRLSDNIIDVEYFWEGKIKKATFYESQILKTED